MTQYSPEKIAHELIRGGRIKKTARGIVSLAPFLASVSAVALGLVPPTSLPAKAGTCTGSAGTYICSGAASTSDSQQTLSAGSGEALTVTSYKDFGIQSSDSLALYLQNTSSSTNMNVVLDGSGIIEAAEYGIYIDHQEQMTHISKLTKILSLEIQDLKRTPHREVVPSP